AFERRLCHGGRGLSVFSAAYQMLARTATCLGWFSPQGSFGPMDEIAHDQASIQLVERFVPVLRVDPCFQIRKAVPAQPSFQPQKGSSAIGRGVCAPSDELNREGSGYRHEGSLIDTHQVEIEDGAPQA